jgi:hypothetical protein
MANTIKIKRGSGSDPSASSMVLGEPVLRTDTAELFFKKDDGSVAKVSGGGGGPDFKYLALRNAANNGAASYPAADFTLVTSGTTTAVSPASASALLCSVSGVIQQPNTGTSTPSSGFAISGSTIKFGSNIPAAPDFIIYQESGGIGEPSDNTVTSAKIVDGAIVNADINASAGIALSKLATTGALGSAVTATTQSASDNSTKIATTAYTDTAISNLVDSSPSALNTLNELAAALGDDANFSTTVTNSIATKLPLAGGTITGNVIYNDSVKNIFGSDSDTQILHNGSNFYIQNKTGDIYIQSNVDDDDSGDIYIQAKNGEHSIICHDDSNVELYFDGVKKLETTSTGVDLRGTVHRLEGLLRPWSATGIDLGTDADRWRDIYVYNDIDMKDDGKLLLGNSDELQIWHDGNTHSYITESGGGGLAIGGSMVSLMNLATTEHMFKGTADSSVELYYDGIKKFETKSDGALVDGDLWINTGGTIKTNSSQGQLTIKGGATYPGGAIKFAGGQSGATDQGTIIFYAGEATSLEERLRITKGGLLLGGTDAQNNTILGANAGDSFSGTSANNNTLIGKNAGTAITLGDGNTVVGTSAFMTAEGGSNNTAIGKDACGLQTSASNNVAVGTAALYDCTTGGTNTAVGSWALENSTTAGSNTAVGHGCFRALTTSNNNTAIGYEAAKRTTTGYNVNVFGIHAAQYNTTGYELVAIGNNALNNHTTGHKNVCVGGGSGYYITTGTANTCVGSGANGGTTGNYNCSFGLNALAASTTGSSNIGIGVMAGDAITTGSNNICIGYDALTSNVSGVKNVAIGAYAGVNTTADENVFIGYQAGQGNSSGYYHVAIGHNAGYHLSTAVNTILIGYNAGNPASPSGQVDDDSNTLCLGNNSITNFYCADTSISSSDQRDKTDIANFTPGLSFVKQLRPITYRWDKRAWYLTDKKVTQAQIDNGDYTQEQLGDEIPPTKAEFLAATPDGSKKEPKQHIGFLAQEVLAVEQAAGFASDRDSMLTVNLTKDETQYGMKYERLVPILVNAIKELETRISTLEAT